MRTNEDNLEKYQKLYEKFEKLLEKKGMNLHQFACEWCQHDDDDEVDKFYNKLLHKRRRIRNKETKQPQQKSIDDLIKYIKFLNGEFIRVELASDESYDHWFDD